MKYKRRKFLVFVTLLVTVSICACQPQLNHVFPTLPPVGQQQLLVTFDRHDDLQLLPNGSARSYRGSDDWSMPLSISMKVRHLEKQFSLHLQKVWPMYSINRHCVVFAIDDTVINDDLLKNIAAVDGVISVQLMNQFEVMTTEIEDAEKMGQSKHGQKIQAYNDTHIQLQYGEYVSSLTRLHQLSRGDSIKIGIIDTLADNLHPDLQGQIAKQHRYVDHQANRETHGTAIAGIISARANNHLGLVGLAPDAKLSIYGACESKDFSRARCNSFNVLQALEQAIKDQIQVLNLSIAGPYDPLIEEVVLVAREKGMVIVAAINGSALSRSFPASMNAVIGVEAFSSNIDTSAHQPELFGDWLAQSEKLSTLTGGGYQFFNGSSISTASISGIAALVRAQTSAQHTQEYIEALAQGNCRYLYSLSNNSFNAILNKSTSCRDNQNVSLGNREPLVHAVYTHK